MVGTLTYGNNPQDKLFSSVQMIPDEIYLKTNTRYTLYHHIENVSGGQSPTSPLNKYYKSATP